MPTKHIKFPPRSQTWKMEYVLAVAWAVAQQPNRSWKANDVTTEVQEYLDKQGCPLLLPQVAEGLRWLARRQYAARVVYGHRVREFVLDPELIVDEPEFVKARRLVAAGKGPVATKASTNGAGQRVHTGRSNGRTATAVLPPVPGVAIPPPWADEVMSLAAEWWRKDDAAANAWAASTVDALRDLLGR